MATLFDTNEPRTPARFPCPDCGYAIGIVTRSPRHWKVSCDRCGRYLYFANQREKAAIAVFSGKLPRLPAA